MNAWGDSVGVSWDSSWGASAPGPVVEEARIAGAGQRIAIRPELAIAARRLAEDNDAILIINVMLASGALEH